MSNTAIEVDGLSKAYRMHLSKGPSLRSRLSSHLREYFGGISRPPLEEDQDLFWALRDVSFDVPTGSSLGIVGKNGSGKSTLLKILSGITPPTDGRALLRGRVGSLLEVGTGFHPDLTGRSNIYMSGGLLGMPRNHIDKKFDQIVDFAGIGDFIDIPVKRYSSGMYVRLAYAVASELETDILILDEVLAVGDAEFRERSQRNIEHMVGQGRTILFVSHSMAAVADMCDHGIVLERGQCTFRGTADDAVEHYMRSIHGVTDEEIDFENGPSYVDLRSAPGWDGSRDVVITSVETMTEDGEPSRLFRTGDAMRLRIGYEVTRETRPYFTVFFIAADGFRAMTLYSDHCSSPLILSGTGFVECVVPELRLTSGDFYITLDFGRIEESYNSIDCVPNATQVRIQLGNYLGGVGVLPHQGWIAQQSHWQARTAAEVDDERGETNATAYG